MSLEPVTAGMDMTKELLTVVGKVIDRLPTYSQKKKEFYHRLVSRFETERSKSYDMRDDNLVGLYKMDLQRFLSVFNEEIETKLKAEWEGE
jgi:hypothetical protein